MGQRFRRYFWFLLAVTIWLGAGAGRFVIAEPAARAGHGNADAIQAAELRDFLTFIASDEMEGRDTPSRGLNTTAKFIAMSLSRWGLKPAGDDGTYFQRIRLRRSRPDPDRMRAEIDGQPFRYGE